MSALDSKTIKHDNRTHCHHSTSHSAGKKITVYHTKQYIYKKS